MRHNPRSRPRRGSIVPLVAVSLTAIMAMVALAIDLGMMMVARNQCQNAADAAAIAGARVLTGDPADEFNKVEAAPAAKAAAKANFVFNEAIDPDAASFGLEVKVGAYRYDEDANKFVQDVSGTKSDAEAWSLVQATVRYKGPTFFARVIPGMDRFDVGATAVSVHRPRDVAIVIDFSGSMKLGSILGGPVANASGQFIDRTYSLNDESSFPRWGHYSISDGAGGPGWMGGYPVTTRTAPTGESIDKSNLVVESDGGTPVVANFFKDTTAFGATSPAFTKNTALTGAVTDPTGMDWPKTQDRPAVWAGNANRVLGRAQNDASPSSDSTFETNGFDGSGVSKPAFASYTEGPSYWGKTFWVWPPDPRSDASADNVAKDNAHKDWRKRFFTKVYLGDTNVTTYATVWPNGKPAGGGGSGSGSGGSGSGAGGGGAFNVTDPSAFNLAPPDAPAAPAPGGAPAAGAFHQTTGFTLGTKYPMNWNFLMYNADTDSLSAADARALAGAGGSAPVDFTDNFTVHDYTSNNVNASNVGGNEVGDGGWRTPGSTSRVLTQSRSAPVLHSEGTTGGMPWKRYKWTLAVSQWTYQVHYDAILYWIKNTSGTDGTSPFPDTLRAGGVLYYSEIPAAIDVKHITGARPAPSTQAEKNERFWKDYIDEVLGLQQSNVGTINGVKYATYSAIWNRVGYGGLLDWNVPNDGSTTHRGPGARQMRLAPPGLVPGTAVDYTDTRYMDYRDNPYRPRTHYWFGPMTMMDFLSNMNLNRYWLPGTATEAPLWQAKRGVAAAVDDIKSNHPNDTVSLIAFSGAAGRRPATGTAVNNGYYNIPRSPLGRDYNVMKNALYFPPKVVKDDAEISPYDADIKEVPRAVGSTNPCYGLMLAYNQFSRGTEDADLRTYFGTTAAEKTQYKGTAGGLGRKGAQKIVIVQTDGVPSQECFGDLDVNNTAVFADNGAHKSWFKVRQRTNGTHTENEYMDYVQFDATNRASKPADNALAVAQAICNAEVPDPAATDPAKMVPGFSTTRKPARIHCIAFGSLYNDTTATEAQKALTFLQKLQRIGGTQASDATALESYKIVTGTSTARISQLEKAFSNIMQDGYSMTLIE